MEFKTACRFLFVIILIAKYATAKVQHRNQNETLVRNEPPDKVVQGLSSNSSSEALTSLQNLTYRNLSNGRSLYPYPQIGFPVYDIPQGIAAHPVHTYPPLLLQPRPVWPLMYQNLFHPIQQIPYPLPQITQTSDEQKLTDDAATPDNASALPERTQFIDPQKEGSSASFFPHRYTSTPHKPSISSTNLQIPDVNENSVIHLPQHGTQHVPAAKNRTQHTNISSFSETTSDHMHDQNMSVTPTSGNNILSSIMPPDLKNNTKSSSDEETQQSHSVANESQKGFGISDSKTASKFPVNASYITAVIKPNHIGLKPSPTAPLRDLSPSQWLEEYKKCRPKPPGNYPPNRPPGRPPKPPVRPPPWPPSRPPRPPIRPPRPPVRPPRPPVRPPRPPVWPPRPPVRPPRPPVRPTPSPSPPEDYDEVIEDDPPALAPPQDYEEEEEEPPMFVPPDEYEDESPVPDESPDEYDDYGDDYDQTPPWWQGVGGEFGEYGLIGEKPLPPNAMYWLKHNVTVKPVYWTELLAPSTSTTNIPLENIASLFNSFRSRGVKKNKKTVTLRTY